MPSVNGCDFRVMARSEGTDVGGGTRPAVVAGVDSLTRPPPKDDSCSKTTASIVHAAAEVN